MPNELKSLHEMTSEATESVLRLYLMDGLPLSFRRDMNEAFIAVQWDRWDILTNEKKVMQLRKIIQTKYRSRTDQESVTLMRRIGERNFMDKLIKCVENELHLHKTYSTQQKPILHTSKSSNPVQYQSVQSTQSKQAIDLIKRGATSLKWISEQRAQIGPKLEFQQWYEECLILLKLCGDVRRLMVQDLQTWNLRKRRQMNLLNGKQDEQLFITQLNEIEVYAQDAVKLLVHLSELCVSQSNDFTPQAKLIELLNFARCEILQFVKDSFIVWQQSHQVLRSKNKFAVDVRLLVGPVLPRGTNVSKVRVEICEEDDNAPDGLGNPSGKTDGTTATHFEQDARPEKLCVAEMNVDNSGRLGQKSSQANSTKDTKLARLSLPEDRISWIAEFRDIKWINEEGRRTGKETDKSVTETRYAAVFETTVCFAGDSQQHKVRCASLPMALFVHLSQGCKSHGNIFWYNAFSYLDEGRFKSRERVSWLEFICQIAKWLCSHTEVPRLAKHNKEFIRKCLCDELDQVTFARFYTEKQAGQLAFNFWEWISGVCELICSDSLLRFLWKKDAVYGFSAPGEAEKLLEKEKHKQHCVLLRFGTKPARVQAAKSSKEQPVGIVIMVVNEGGSIIKVEALSKAQLQDNNLYVRLTTEQLKRPKMLQRSADGQPITIDWVECLLPEYEANIAPLDCESAEQTVFRTNTPYVMTEDLPIVKHDSLPFSNRGDDLAKCQPTIPSSNRGDDLAEIQPTIREVIPNDLLNLADINLDSDPLADADGD